MRTIAESKLDSQGEGGLGGGPLTEMLSNEYNVEVWSAFMEVALQCQRTRL